MPIFFQIVLWGYECYLETHGKLLEGSVEDSFNMGKQKFLELDLETKCVAKTYTLCLKGDPQYFTYELAQSILQENNFIILK